jgi:tetratricopeptide (TPR) repeat protein
MRHEIDQAELRINRALTELQRIENKGTVARAKSLLGVILLERGDDQGAEKLILEGLEAYRATGSTYAWADLLDNVGNLAFHRRDYLTAMEWYQQALEAAQAQGDLPRLVVYQLSIGRALAALGRKAEAAAIFQQCQETARQCGRLDIEASAALSLAKLRAHTEHSGTDVTLARKALDLFRRLGMKREQAEAEALLLQLGEQP